MSAAPARPAAGVGARLPPAAPQHPTPLVTETLDSRTLQFTASAIQSRMRVQSADTLDLEYTRLMMGFLLFHPAPPAIALIGLGGGSLVKFCHRHLPRSGLVVAEINPQVVALRDAFEVPADDTRLQVVTACGAAFVRDSATRFEVLLVDGFDADGLPKALRSQRFYDDCADALRPGGLMVANLHHEPLHCDTCVERIRRSFAGSVLLVDDTDGSNRVVFAWKGAFTAPLVSATLARRAGLGAAAIASLQPAFERIRSAIGRQLGPDLRRA